jgi:hypothetical protein
MYFIVMAGSIRIWICVFVTEISDQYCMGSMGTSVINIGTRQLHTMKSIIGL